MGCVHLATSDRFSFHHSLSRPPPHPRFLMETAQLGSPSKTDTCLWCFLSCLLKSRRQNHQPGRSINWNQSHGKKSCHKLRSRKKVCCFLSSRPKHQKSAQKTERSLHMLIWPPDLPVLPVSYPRWKNKPQKMGFISRVSSQPQISSTQAQISQTLLLLQTQALTRTTKSLAPWNVPRKSSHAGRCWSLPNLRACVPLTTSQETRCSLHRQRTMKVLNQSYLYPHQCVSHTWLVFQLGLSSKPTLQAVSYI